MSKILRTTLGVLAIGSDYEIEYLLLNAPSTGTTTTTKNEILENTFVQRVDYKDIVSEIRYFNKHGKISYDNPSYSTLTDTINTDNDVSNKVKYLHDIDKVKDIEHLAADTTNTFTRLKSLLYERRAIYSFSTKGQHFESVLNEDVTLSRDDIIGGDATKDVTMVELDKRPDQTDIVCLDLLGL